MNQDAFIANVQKFTAISAVGVSALRRQGVGIIGRIQEHLGSVDLTALGQSRIEPDFRGWLDEQTRTLVRAYHVRWGAARKALNLFLRDCLYNKYLSARYRLDHLETWMEIPLDSIVTKHLKQDAGWGRLPIWRGLRQLTETESQRFQNHANEMASRQQMARVHLDVGIWLNNR